MNNFLTRIKRFCGIVVGAVFFLSGLIKLMDPAGAGLVMNEYFQFLNIEFMSFADTALGVAFALAETILGVALITGVWRRPVVFITIGFQVFFTILTILLVIFNPTMDCGCFGEAIHLTHTQTLLKNIILLTLLTAYAVPVRRLGNPQKKKYVSFAIVSTSVVAFTIYSMLYLPLIDFTQYSPGTSIKMEDIYTEDMYESVFIYEKNGVKQEFTLETLPDSTWTFVNAETKQTKTQKQATALSFSDKDGQYADSLAWNGKVMIVSIYDTDVSESDIKEITSFKANAQKAGFRVLILTATDATENSYTCDYKTLITLNRSNCGATYINDGYIISKWAKKSLPDYEELAKISKEDLTDTMIDKGSKTDVAFQGFLLYVFAVMLLL